MSLDKQKIITIFHGPQHPGITGNMSVELDLIGETIQRAQTHVGYLHRGFEKLVERRTIVQGFTIVCRICVPEPDPNEENYARAVEGLSGLEISDKAAWIRTMVLEMARLANFFLWMGGQAGSIGLGLIPQWSVCDRDYMLDLFEELTGGRVYHMYAFPGGVRRDLPAGFLEKLEALLRYYEERIEVYNNTFFDNVMFKTRAIGVGIVTKEDVLKNAYVGQVMRGCGIKRDVRKDMPYLMYDQLDFDIPTQSDGDVYARALVRRDEALQSIKILRQIIQQMPKEGEILQKIPKHRKFVLPKDDIYVQTETSRGAMSYYMAGDGTEKIRRMQVRGPSLIHGFTLLEKLLVGSELSDVAMTMNSLGICPPEIER
ncbi:NADH-quinone oxidoreductase subunit D [Sulfurospirillum sp. 1612]|uniref:NADH-quinone oxidoreductase subunit D n=1 Tax=Sulfurospirillum sp. 1612 TaxID=3094835 RepID=UPI002F95E738